MKMPCSYKESKDDPTCASDFCPQCGQVKHVGYDLCVDCLYPEFDDFETEDVEEDNRIFSFLFAFLMAGIICGVGIAVFLYVISYGWRVI